MSKTNMNFHIICIYKFPLLCYSNL